MRDMLIVIIMGVLYFAAFYKVPEKYTPIASQKIYDMFAGEDTSTEQTQESLAIIDINKMKPEQKQEPAAKVNNLINEQKRVQKKETKQHIKEVVESQQPGKTEEVNYYSIRDYVSNSSKSYFFNDIKAEAGKVSLRLISYTPYNNKGILKIEIINSSSAYFFIGGISITSPGENILEKPYGDQFIKAEGTLTLYCVIKTATKKGLNLKVLESEDSKKALKVDFNLP